MHKKISLITLLIMIFIFSSCNNNNNIKIENETLIQEKINENQLNNNQKQEIENYNEEIKILSNEIIIEDITKIKTSDPQIYGHIIKEENKEDYILFIKMLFTKNQQFTQIQGEYLSTIPIAVNIVCGLYSEIIYEKLLPDDKITIEEEFLKAIKDKNIRLLIISFEEEETKEEIAKCEIIGSEWEDITFHEYKTYKKTFLNATIGQR
jgi:hypothetical protein